jgi:hypothetical protein
MLIQGHLHWQWLRLQRDLSMGQFHHRSARKLQARFEQGLWFRMTSAKGSESEFQLLAKSGPKLTDGCWQNKLFNMPHRNGRFVPGPVIEADWQPYPLSGDRQTTRYCRH